MQLFDYKISLSYPRNLGTQKLIINTINPHSYIVAKKDAVFQAALLDADILLPDGIGIVYAFKYLHKKKINRISGWDIHAHLLENLNGKYGKVFYLGSSDETLALIQTRLKVDYPNIWFECYSPPFKPEFDEGDNLIMFEKINAFQPDILFVGMTAPKQEKWVYNNKEFLSVPIVCSIGAVFDFYAGTVQRPGPFWINLGLEWLPRLVKNPKRLWRRTFSSTPSFVWDVFVGKWKYKTNNEEQLLDAIAEQDKLKTLGKN